MFVGHALLAFAVVALVARRFDAAPRRALALGGVAALFATIPDVDVVYGLVGLAGSLAGPEAPLAAFFDAGNVAHRGPTHSLVVGVVAATGLALASVGRSLHRTAGIAVLAGVVALVATLGTALDVAVTALFALAGLGVVSVAHRFSLSPRHVGATAAVGLLTHPFGDLFTGEPPAMLFPFDATLVAERIVLHPDPTVHLLAAFAVELAVVWVVFVVYLRVTDRDLRSLVDRRAVVGLGYGAAVLVVPAPTLETAEPFVFSVLALGVVGIAPTRRRWRPDAHRAVGTGLTAVTLALGAYTVTYLLL